MELILSSHETAYHYQVIAGGLVMDIEKREKDDGHATGDDSSQDSSISTERLVFNFHRAAIYEQ